MAPALNITTLAERMLEDYDSHNPGTVFAEGLRLSITDAYRLQAQVAQLRERRGEQLVGYKIGCVCSENQERHGLSHPVYGRLWSTEQYSNDVDLATRDFANVAIEGEFAVTLRDDVELGNPRSAQWPQQWTTSSRSSSSTIWFFVVTREAPN